MSKLQYIDNTNQTIKADILKQFQALHGLNLSLEDRVKIISSDVSYRYKLAYSVIKQMTQRAFIDFIPIEKDILADL